MSDNEVTFSIVTATYNAADVLPSLIKSLQAQTDTDFEWIVADGGSTDGTLELLEEASKTLNVRVDSRPDFGIYDALNRGVKQASGQYYLVVGADDGLYANAVADFKQAISDDVDVVTALVDTGNGVRKPRKGPVWLYGRYACLFSAHAVGSAFRKSLHKRFGYYSRKYPIAADSFFMSKLAQAGVKVATLESVVGRFELAGISNTDYVGAVTEHYRVLIECGENRLVQTALLILRLLKNFRRLR